MGMGTSLELQEYHHKKISNIERIDANNDRQLLIHPSLDCIKMICACLETSLSSVTALEDSPSQIEAPWENCGNCRRSIAIIQYLTISYNIIIQYNMSISFNIYQDLIRSQMHCNVRETRNPRISMWRNEFTQIHQLRGQTNAKKCEELIRTHKNSRQNMSTSCQLHVNFMSSSCHLHVMSHLQLS